MKLVDMHCDTIGCIQKTYRETGVWKKLRENDLHLDIQKMIQGDYLLQNFAILIDYYY